jgi:hypothetical protein
MTLLTGLSTSPRCELKTIPKASLRMMRKRRVAVIVIVTIRLMRTAIVVEALTKFQEVMAMQPRIMRMVVVDSLTYHLLYRCVRSSK